MRTALIVEDLPDPRAWLQHAVGVAFPGIAVTTADCVAQARKALNQQVPDLALVDLGLPDGSGLEVIRRIAETAPETVVVVSSVFADDEHVFPALRAGARGYVLKDQSTEDLVPLLRGIVSGQPPLSPAITRRLLSFFGPAEPNADTLTPREVEVLTLIAKGLANAKVAAVLGISPHTASGYVKEIYRKLSVSSRAEATLEAARRGIVSNLL
ncbi:MAG: response regulator transcription factor [Alphaproteobacteria bacterium]|nr:response regulator transcription factor [Alphaproteobacteria bacterium]